MDVFLNLVAGGIVAVIIICCVKKKKEREEIEKKLAEDRLKQQQELLRQKWEDKKNEIATNGLPVVNSETLKLTKSETCHFMGDAYYCKIRQGTVGYEGGNNGVSLKVMKGVSFRVGNYKGHYIKDEIIERTNGLIYLTNKKIVFTGLQNSAVIKYDDIINLSVEDNILQIQTENKSCLFQVDDSIDFMVILECVMNQQEDTKEV